MSFIPPPFFQSINFCTPPLFGKFFNIISILYLLLMERQTKQGVHSQKICSCQRCRGKIVSYHTWHRHRERYRGKEEPDSVDSLSSEEGLMDIVQVSNEIDELDEDDRLDED